MRLLRPEHVIEQWQAQQAEAAERAASAQQAAFTIPADPSPAAAAAAGPGLASPGGGEGPLPPTTATVKQPPGQVAQAKFALTSSFLEKVAGRAALWLAMC